MNIAFTQLQYWPSTQREHAVRLLLVLAERQRGVTTLYISKDGERMVTYVRIMLYYDLDIKIVPLEQTEIQEMR